jgi:hypothetical protein
MTYDADAVIEQTPNETQRLCSNRSGNAGYSGVVDDRSIVGTGSRHANKEISDMAPQRAVAATLLGSSRSRGVSAVSQRTSISRLCVGAQKQNNGAR